MTAFYVLARPMTPGKHQHWRCVGKHDDYAAADVQSCKWERKPAHEAQVVAAGALSKAHLERYDAELVERAARVNA